MPMINDFIIYKILETIILNNPIQVSGTELKEKNILR